MYRNVKNIVWIFSLISIVLPQRDFDEELKYQNESIESLKKEMEDLRKKIEKMSDLENRKITSAIKTLSSLKVIELKGQRIEVIEKKRAINHNEYSSLCKNHCLVNTKNEPLAPNPSKARLIII